MNATNASSSSSSSASSSSAANDTVLLPEEIGIGLTDYLLQSWFTTNFDEGETQLLAGLNTQLAKLDADSVVCDGLPSLQTRSSAGTPNGWCPSVFTAVNDSCTCIVGFEQSNTWEFNVQRRSSNISGFPLMLPSSAVLAIDAIRTFWVPSSLQTLRIVGAESSPVALEFLPDDRLATTTDLILAAGNTSNLTNIEIENINMSSVVTSVSSFIPSKTTNLTLRNCGITSLSSAFMTSLPATIQYLDISANSLNTPYVGATASNACTNSLCSVKVLNISYNNLTKFPESVLYVDDLRKLYIQGNAITDFNVTTTLFQLINALEDFDSDLPDNAAVCDDGEWKTSHGSNFCVQTEATSAPSVSSSSDLYYVLYAIIGGMVVIICILLALLVRKYCSFANKDRRTAQDDYVSILGSSSHSEDSFLTMLAYLLQDPVIMANRIPYKEVRLGKCISKGAVGLVFGGKYKGRPVAIKKIAPEHTEDVVQLERFINEITLMATLHHPRIVQFIGVAWSSLRNLSAITEFMERGDLRDVLQAFSHSDYPLTWANHKTTIALHIAEALMYLHSLNPKVIHRDLKSKNVLLNKDFDAKVSDFGTARERPFAETHMTTGVGTSFWIAPEVLLGQNYDERADIFSFGVVLAEIDTDDYPYWNARNPPGGKIQEGDILRMVASGILRPTFSEECPRQILTLAMRCLHGDPAYRPAAAEIVYVLRQLVQGNSWSSSSSTSMRMQQQYDY